MLEILGRLYLVSWFIVGFFCGLLALMGLVSDLTNKPLPEGVGLLFYIGLLYVLLPFIYNTIVWIIKG